MANDPLTQLITLLASVIAQGKANGKRENSSTTDVQCDGYKTGA